MEHECDCNGAAPRLEWSARSNDFAAFKTRNAAMVDRAMECGDGRLLGLWNGDKRSGTYSCLAYASRVWCPLWVEAIEGSDK